GAGELREVLRRGVLALQDRDVRRHEAGRRRVRAHAGRRIAFSSTTEANDWIATDTRPPLARVALRARIPIVARTNSGGVNTVRASARVVRANVAVIAVRRRYTATGNQRIRAHTVGRVARAGLVARIQRLADRRRSRSADAGLASVAVGAE